MQYILHITFFLHQINHRSIDEFGFFLYPIKEQCILGDTICKIQTFSTILLYMFSLSPDGIKK